MTITMVLLALKAKRPPTARYVLWPRIDQKTCAKAVVTAGLELISIPMILDGDQLVTDVKAIEAEIEARGADSILAVLTTTSCFAPRGPDDVIQVIPLLTL
jgi:O-phospho-L-seryl-tRNASec:L-selenocysteinyl-tRNA synthase